MEELDGKEMGGSNIEVSLAKPPSDKKKKEEILRARERRMMQMMQVRGGYVHVKMTSHDLRNSFKLVRFCYVLIFSFFYFFLLYF